MLATVTSSHRAQKEFLCPAFSDLSREKLPIQLLASCLVLTCLLAALENHPQSLQTSVVHPPSLFLSPSAEDKQLLLFPLPTAKTMLVSTLATGPVSQGRLHLIKSLHSYISNTFNLVPHICSWAQTHTSNCLLDMFIQLSNISVNSASPSVPDSGSFKYQEMVPAFTGCLNQKLPFSNPHLADTLH